LPRRIARWDSKKEGRRKASARWTCRLGRMSTKEEYFAEVLDDAGDRLRSVPLGHEQVALDALLEWPPTISGRPGDRAARLDRTAHRGANPAARGAGGVRSRFGDPPDGGPISRGGEDRRDAFVTEDNVRSRRRKVHCRVDHFDELLERLGVLNKVDVVFAADHTRLINRRRPAGSSVSPPRETSGDSRAA